MPTDWKKLVNEAIQEFIVEKKLYENAVYLAENYGKSGEIISYSICFWEKDYPDTEKETSVFDKNMVVVNIKDPGLAKRPETLKLSTINYDGKMPEDIEFVNNKIPYWLLPKQSNGFKEFFKNLMNASYMNYSGKGEEFGCCSKFSECSDARECLHINQLYAKSCMYRKNLEAGKIFYGNDKTE